jgi:hypothetical protein
LDLPFQADGITLAFQQPKPKRLQNILDIEPIFQHRRKTAERAAWAPSEELKTIVQNDLDKKSRRFVETLTAVPHEE